MDHFITNQLAKTQGRTPPIQETVQQETYYTLKITKQNKGTMEE